MNPHLFKPKAGCLFAILFIVGLTSFSQTPRVLYGNFVWEESVYQYEYKKDRNIHTLRLSTLSEKSPVQLLDSTKLDNTTKTFSKLIEDSLSLRSGLRDTIRQLESFVSEIQRLQVSGKTWKIHLGAIDSAKKLSNISRLDSLMKSKNVPDIYSVDELLTSYGNFLRIADEPKQSKSIPFAELKEDVFRRIFVKQMKDLQDSKSFSLAQSESLLLKSSEVMYEIRARYEFEDDEPMTAYLNLKKKFISLDVIVWDTVKFKKFLGLNFGKTLLAEIKMPVAFKLSNLQVEFEEGTMKHIVVDMVPMLNPYQDEFNGYPIRFRNDKPVSISGKFDSDNFANQRIFVSNSRELMKTLYADAKTFTNKPWLSADRFMKNNKQLHFVLSELLDYVFIPRNNTEDYSPADTVVELNENRTTAVLKKERRSRILSARAYTDFIGLNDEQPNGLVQIEVFRRLSLFTERNQLNGMLPVIRKLPMYSGMLTFIQPRFSLNKLEENNRYLNLDSNVLNRSTTFEEGKLNFNVNPIDLLKHRQWSIDLTVNIAKWNLINQKTTLYINANGAYSRTPISDSLAVGENSILKIPSRNISRLNTGSYGFTVSCEFKPDARWGLAFGYDVNWQKVFHPNFEFGSTYDNMYHTNWLEGSLKPNNSSGLFFRFRKHWMNRSPKINFYQVQLGYQLDLFKTN